MKFVIFAFLILSVQICKAQNAAESSVAQTPALPTVASQTNYLVGASFLQWNESLHLHQAGSFDTDSANFSGFAVQGTYETNYAYWGWNVMGLLGSARASGGNNSTLITYAQTGRPCAVLAAVPEIFYRPSERISLGVGVPLFFRSVSWPDQGNVTAQSGHNFDVGLNVNFDVRITDHWEAYQSLGALSQDSSTLWQIGVNYRLN